MVALEREIGQWKDYSNVGEGRLKEQLVAARAEVLRPPLYAFLVISYVDTMWWLVLLPRCPRQHGYFGPGSPQTVKIGRFSEIVWPPARQHSVGSGIVT